MGIEYRSEASTVPEGRAEMAYTIVGTVLRRFLSDEMAGILAELALVALLVLLVMRTCSGMAAIWLEIRSIRKHSVRRRKRKYGTISSSRRSGSDVGLSGDSGIDSW